MPTLTKGCSEFQIKAPFPPKGDQPQVVGRLIETARHQPHKSIVVTAFSDEGQMVLRGKKFSSQDLEVISSCVHEHSCRGRTYISKVICEELDWKQPNGWPKDRACRDVLLRLERIGKIQLPQRLTKSRGAVQRAKSKPAGLLADYDMSTLVTEFPKQIVLERAKSSKSEKLWNEVVGCHHYLGHRVVVGRCIKYLIKTDEVLLGAVSFSSPAYKLSCRDALLNRIGIGVADVQERVINNSRLLFLPNVRVKHLASRILSLATAKVVEDWTQYYSVTPLVVETFVQPSLHRGTCYKAANWVDIGLTKGYLKRGSTHHNSQEPKRILLYGLNKSVRRKLQKAVESEQGVKKRKA